MLLSHGNALFTSHIGQSGGRGLSPRIWSRLDGQAQAPAGSGGMWGLFEDFENFGSVATSANTGWGVFLDTSCTIANTATDPGGVIRFSTTTTDNADAIITSGGNSGALGKIASSAGKLTLFEARFRVQQITNTYNMFIGMTQEGCAVTDGIVTDSGALADVDMIGFSVLEAAGDTLNFVYKKNGQTAVTKIAGIKTLVADTWYKVGFVFDPRGITKGSTDRIAVYADNVENGTYVTQANIEAATFPESQMLAITAGIKNQTNVAKTFDLDWVGFAQAN